MNKRDWHRLANEVSTMSLTSGGRLICLVSCTSTEYTEARFSFSSIGAKRRRLCQNAALSPLPRKYPYKKATKGENSPESWLVVSLH